MKGVIRNIKFFGWLNGKVLLMMSVFVLIFPALFCLMDEGSFLENYVSALGFYLMIMGPIILFMQAGVGYTKYLQTAVAMSSTRKSALTGMTAAAYLLAALLTAVTLLLYAVLPMQTDYFQYKYQIIAVMLFTLFAINIMGAVIIAMGPKAGFVVYFISYMVVILVIMGTMFMAKDNQTAEIIAWMNSWKVVPAGIVLSGSSLIAPYLVIRKLEARV